ncbi:MAG TPA: tetratricopeptide repeat protein [Verrucomicrobiae bacterium]|jgi:tetratricopeptide (TPR) repeat protein|nr:tetratricopeptide repeat protein [Verrucomicrobiae bacterium]
MILIWGAAAILAAVFLAYWPIVPGTFLMDDRRLVETDNPLVNGQLLPLSIWFQTDFPLCNLAFLLEWRAWGYHPEFYHLASMTLHALSAVLVWRLLSQLRIRGAWLAGMLFAVHPVCVNSVARIAELKNTLSLPFFLLSMLFYLRYEAAVLYPENPPDRPRRIATFYYTFSVIAFILALFTKTSTVMLPVALLACAAWQRRKLSRRDLVHTSPHFLLAMSFGLMSVWFQKYQALADQTLPPVSLPGRLVVASKVFLFYLEKILAPVNLCLVYPRWDPGEHSLAAFFPMILICTGGLLCWGLRRGWGRHVLFALISFAILLFPALGFFDAQYLVKWQVSDHLQYLPLIAPLALVSAAMVRIMKSRRQWMSSAALLILFVLTSQRARVFSTQESLMRDTLAKNPLASDAHNDLGVVLARRQDVSGALEQFKAAAQTNPLNLAAHANLAQVLAAQGNFAEAKLHFRSILDAKPFDADAHIRLAQILGAEGRFREGRAHLALALAFKPTAGTRLLLAQMSYGTGAYFVAMRQFRQLVLLQPDSPQMLNSLAWVLATCPDDRLRDGPEAVRRAERACQLTGFKESPYLSTLAAAYAEAGHFSEAVSTAETGLRLQIAAGENGATGINRQLLACYQAGRPFHEAPPAAPGDL